MSDVQNEFEALESLDDRQVIGRRIVWHEETESTNDDARHAAEALLAVATLVFCTSYPPGALYGALQAAVFYLVLGMGLSVLTKSDATGAMLCIGVLIANIPFQAGNTRVSPFFNPTRLEDGVAADVLAWTVQNRIGFLLVIAAISVLSFARADRREKMLGS